MKKIIAMSVSVLLVLSLVFSFTGCTDEPVVNEEPTTVFVRMDTVPEENVVSYINSVIEKTNAAAPTINVSESFGVNDPKALTAADYDAYLLGEELAGNDALNTLDDTLGFIKTYLMSGFSAPVPEITALTAIDNADVAEVVDYSDKTARNWTSENVTDEEGESIAYEEDVPKYEFDMDGNEMLDQPVTNEEGEQEYYENGDVMFKSYVCDNKLKATVSFLEKPEEETSAITFADASIINKYFPNTVDKDYVLTELKKVESAVAISDYSVEYRDCTIAFEIDMETEQILSATFTKNAFVTFDAQGMGSFSNLGEFKLCFTFVDTINCTFDYSADATASDTATEEDTEVVTEEVTETVSDEVTEEVTDKLTAGDAEEATAESENATVPEIAIEATESVAD